MIQSDTSTLEFGTFENIIKCNDAIPIIGLPRSGKSTLIKNIINVADSRDIMRILICNDEFDGFENSLSDFVIEGFRCDDAHLNNLEHLISFLNVRLLIIDSLKKLVFEGASLRKGGISNQIFDHFNKLHYIANRHNMTILYSINSGSNDAVFNEEIVSILLGCSNSVITVKKRMSSFFLRNVDGERASISDIISSL